LEGQNGIILTAIMLGGAGKAALESTDEAGMMPVADGVGYLLDGHIAYHEELGCFQEPFFRHQTAQLDTGVLFKEPL